MESIFIETEIKLHKSIVVGSLYRVPSSLECIFNKKYKELLQSILSETNKELIIGIDQNLDLLKTHIYHQTQQYLKINLDHNLLPVITRPTRITQSSVTLIDNIYFCTGLQKFQILQTDTLEKSMAMSLGHPNSNFLTIEVGDLTFPGFRK